MKEGGAGEREKYIIMLRMFVLIDTRAAYMAFHSALPHKDSLTEMRLLPSCFLFPPQSFFFLFFS